MSSVNASPDPMQNESKRIKKKTASDDVSTVNDSIMMFVGQLPREMDEEQLTKLFEEFGSVDLVNIIRNRKSQESQGCCFVTFSHRYDAFRCQAALNNHKRFPGLHRPVQMKPADSESETKLFIGMLPSVSDDNAVKEIFAPFGNIVDCTVLKDQDGASKRCGFVTYSNRTSAIKAINALNQNYKVPGSNHYIVVKFADKDQSRKRSSVGSQHDTSSNNRMRDLFKYTNSNNDTSDNGFKDLIILYDLLEKYGIVCNGNLNLQRLTLVLDAFADLRSAGSNMRNMDNLHDIGMPSHMNDPLQRALNSKGSNSYNSMQQSQDLDSPSGGFGNNFQRKRRQDFSRF